MPWFSMVKVVLFLVPQIKAPKLMIEEGLMVNLEYTAFTENLMGMLAIISPSGRLGSIIYSGKKVREGVSQ